MELENPENVFNFMAFLLKADLLRYIDLSTLDQLTDGDDTIVDEAILDVEERIREKISQRVDTDSELTKTGTSRNRSLLAHSINLAIYYLFKRLYTDVLPEGRVQGMEDAEQWLTDIAEGNISVLMDKQDEANQQGWSIRWGSDEKKGSQNW